MFLGRFREMKVLQESFGRSDFQMTVVYGRRRIGKSNMITEFLKGKRSSYYIATKAPLAENLKNWAEQFIGDLNLPFSGVTFESFEKFFQFMAQVCKEERTIIALDEIPYIAETDESFLSIFQKGIDTYLSKSNIYLIVCGSAVSFMEKEVLSEKSPLFGRRTNQIFLKPFDFKESALFVPNYTAEEKMIAYGVTGGVAKYLSLFDDSKSLDENLIDNFFKTSGYLYEEPSNLLSQEFRNVSAYNSVIAVCSNGANKVNEIADKAHISTALLSYILKSLQTVGIISKISAITDEKNKKKTKYEITDGLYRFWYRFIPAARASIEMGRGEKYYYANVKPRLHEFMGEVFERICREHTLNLGLEGRLNCPITSVGTWWGTNRDRTQTDIDVVGIDEVAKKAVLGECKFTNEPIDKDVYDALFDRKGLIDSRYSEVQFLFFSLSGFSKWMQEESDKEQVKLISVEEMYE